MQHMNLETNQPAANTLLPTPPGTPLPRPTNTPPPGYRQAGTLPLPSTPLPLSTHPPPPVFIYVPARPPLRFTPPPPPPPQPRFTCTTNEPHPRQPEQADAYVASSIQKLTPRPTSVEPQPRPSSSQDSQQLHSKRKRCEQSTSHNNVTAT